MEKIGEVIKIINNENVLISLGTKDGIKKGDFILIFEKGKPVIYKEKNFGTLDYNKKKLEVIEAYEQMSLCADKIIVKKNYAETPSKVLINSLNDAFKRANLLTYEVEELKPLNVNQHEIDNSFANELDKFNRPIQLGDSVKKLDDII